MTVNHKQRLADLNSSILPKFQLREALQAVSAVETDPVLKVDLDEQILLFRNEIVDQVIKDVPDFLDAIVYGWHNTFSYDEARSYVLENLLESVGRYKTTKIPFCKFTSFFWMYNKNLLRNRLKKTRAAKRDQRKTHSLDALITPQDDESSSYHYDVFGTDGDILEKYADRSLLKALYDNATPKQRRVLKRLYLGYSQSDIAEALKVTGTNINTVIKRLRKDLAKML